MLRDLDLIAVEHFRLDALIFCILLYCRSTRCSLFGRVYAEEAHYYTNHLHHTANTQRQPQHLQ